MKIQPDIFIVTGYPQNFVTFDELKAISIARKRIDAGGSNVKIIPAAVVGEVTYFDTDSMVINQKEFS